jgi:hypothetical protein
MGIGESHAHFGKAVHVWRAGLGVTAHPSDPIIEIVRDDEDNIGGTGGSFGGLLDGYHGSGGPLSSGQG